MTNKAFFFRLAVAFLSAAAICKSVTIWTHSLTNRNDWWTQVSCGGSASTTNTGCPNNSTCGVVSGACRMYHEFTDARGYQNLRVRYTFVARALETDDDDACLIQLSTSDSSSFTTVVTYDSSDNDNVKTAQIVHFGAAADDQPSISWGVQATNDNINDRCLFDDISLLGDLITDDPTVHPTPDPTAHPTSSTAEPSSAPSSFPTFNPSRLPSHHPSEYPSATPSEYPSLDPSAHPTAYPSSYPTMSPSFVPSMHPTMYPSLYPSAVPSFTPTRFPSVIPTDYPSAYPTPLPTCVQRQTFKIDVSALNPIDARFINNTHSLFFDLQIEDKFIVTDTEILESSVHSITFQISTNYVCNINPSVFQNAMYAKIEATYPSQGISVEINSGQTQDDNDDDDDDDQNTKRKNDKNKSNSKRGGDGGAALVGFMDDAYVIVAIVLIVILCVVIAVLITKIVSFARHNKRSKKNNPANAKEMKGTSQHTHTHTHQMQMQRIHSTNSSFIVGTSTDGGRSRSPDPRLLPPSTAAMPPPLLACTEMVMISANHSVQDDLMMDMDAGAGRAATGTGTAGSMSDSSVDVFVNVNHMQMPTVSVQLDVGAIISTANLPEWHEDTDDDDLHDVNDTDNDGSMESNDMYNNDGDPALLNAVTKTAGMDMDITTKGETLSDI